MLTLPSSVRVFLALDPVSMHVSFDRLAGLVHGLGLDPSSVSGVPRKARGSKLQRHGAGGSAPLL